MQRMTGAGAEMQRDFRPVARLYEEDLSRLLATHPRLGPVYHRFATYMLDQRRGYSQKSQVWYRLFKKLFNTGNPLA